MMSVSAGRPSRGARVTPPARLLRFHCNDLMNLLIMGGTPDARWAVVRSFHDQSRTRLGPLVRVDAGTEEDRIRLSLESWMSYQGGKGRGDLLRFVERGTLFLDSITALSPETQRMLLAFTRLCADGDFENLEPGWNGRLAVGSDVPLSHAISRARFSSALYDALDKVRIELPVTRELGRTAARSCSRFGMTTAFTFDQMSLAKPSD